MERGIEEYDSPARRKTQTVTFPFLLFLSPSPSSLDPWAISTYFQSFSDTSLHLYTRVYSSVRSSLNPFVRWNFGKNHLELQIRGGKQCSHENCRKEVENNAVASICPPGHAVFCPSSPFAAKTFSPPLFYPSI